MAELQTEQSITKNIMRFFEDRSLAQWDLLDTIFTEIRENKVLK
ncbi:MAG: hypothetical protein R3327_04190 [Nitrosopumilaceae archaeon]|nr:hypothetical protein [Nitrosopumilaceae archaeon]